VNFILENRWVILVSLEVLAWFSTFFVFYARYAMKSTFWFRVASVLFAITGIIPQVIIGIINFMHNRNLDLFTLIIVVLIIYGLTFGKKELKKLDAWAKSKFSKQK
jgi:hypothetical protein